MTKLEAIAARHAARTPGRWVWDDSGLWAEDDTGGAAERVLFNDYTHAYTGTPDLTIPNYHDEEFINAAGEDIALLLHVAAYAQHVDCKGGTFCPACELEKPE